MWIVPLAILGLPMVFWFLSHRYPAARIALLVYALLMGGFGGGILVWGAYGDDRVRARTEDDVEHHLRQDMEGAASCAGCVMLAWAGLWSIVFKIMRKKRTETTNTVEPSSGSPVK